MEKRQIKLNNDFTYYFITNDGKLYNEKTKRWYKDSLSGGYHKYDLIQNSKKYSKLTHRLVAEAFIPNPLNLPVVNHKDGNKLNNSVENLEQISYSRNILHSYYEVGHKNVQQVGKYDLAGRLIEVYLSCADASRKNPGTYPNLISNVCNGKAKTHKGFIWKYIT